MENVISYYYNLNVDNAKLINNVLIIESSKKLFVAKIIHDLDNFNQVINNLGPEYYLPILNKEGKFYFEYNGTNYALFMADNPSIIIGNNLIYQPVISDTLVDYTTIWENNIDYFIKRITETDRVEVEKINMLNYYIGMSENAITINEKAKKMNGIARLSISHFRISYPNYNLTYKDPTELLIDYISRDIAEYTKSNFFFSSMNCSELIGLISRMNLNDKEVMFLFARLMYPSYFFDAISENNIDKQEIIKEKREKYENFLFESLKQIKTTNLYLNIDWLSH